MQMVAISCLNLSQFFNLSTDKTILCAVIFPALESGIENFYLLNEGQTFYYSGMSFLRYVKVNYFHYFKLIIFDHF